MALETLLFAAFLSLHVYFPTGSASFDAISADFQTTYDLSSPCVGLVVQDGELLKRAFNDSLPYVRHIHQERNDGHQLATTTYDPRLYTYELSRPCRAVPLWFAMNAWNSLHN